ncbi:hypothetical protein CsatA_003097 [Cannabis sativa]
MNRDNEDGNNTIIEVSMVLEAAKEGNVATLNHLIEKDSLILTRVSLTNSTQSPLHISAALNHLHFTKQLIHLKPELAFELDSFKRSPLHSAAAEGHMEIARALVHVNRDVSLVKDMYGRIPLHYAAMRGRVDVVQLLLDAQPESVFELLPSGETVFHLCVRHNHLETLRLLVEAVLLVRRESAGDFLNAKEESGDGNTILHLAVMLNHAETVEYLVSIPGVKEDTLNSKGYKPTDLLDHHHLPTDSNTIKIKQLLGINHPKSSCWKSWMIIIERLTNHQRDWLKEMRGSIMVVATVIASTTFNSAINPPGGVWQETSNKKDNKGDTDPFNCDKHTCMAGTGVLAYVWEEGYLRFILFNSIAFLASLSVVLLIVGGLPLRSRIGVWLLTMVICVTLTFTALTFLDGMSLVCPNHIFDSVDYIYHKSLKAWIGLLITIAVYHTIYFFIWVINKVRTYRATRS